MKLTNPEKLMSLIAFIGLIILFIVGFMMLKKMSRRVEDLEKQNPLIRSEITKVQQTIKTQEQNTLNYFRMVDSKIDDKFNQLINALKAKDGDFTLPEPPRRVTFAPEYPQMPYWPQQQQQPQMYGNFPPSGFPQSMNYQQPSQQMPSFPGMNFQGDASSLLNGI